MEELSLGTQVFLFFFHFLCIFKKSFLQKRTMFLVTVQLSDTIMLISVNIATLK